MVRKKTSNLTRFSEGSRIFQQYFIIDMENNMTKIKYRFKDLTFFVFCVFYMTFYNLQNSVKLYQNEGNGMPRNIDLKMLPGDKPRTRPDVCCAFVARFIPPPTFLTQVPPLIPGKLPGRCWDTRNNLISPPPP